MRFVTRPVHTFLPLEDVPPNGDSRHMRQGVRVRVVRPRRVIRVGYRLTKADAPPCPPEVLHSVEVARAMAKGLPAPAYPRGELLRRKGLTRAERKVADMWSYIWLNEQGFGGQERSVEVEEVDFYEGAVATVEGKVNARIGVYYPPVYYGPGYDREPGGLSEARTVVLVHTGAGDLHGRRLVGS